ncbi:MAG: hypothetical protein Q9219_007488 [cf. Caloplaca sp. 3 TL-2023]
MAVPGQDEELWAASYMTLFGVDRHEVPSPFLSVDTDDLSTSLAYRLKQQPDLAIDIVTFFDQDAAMRRHHELSREAIQRRFEAVETERIEQAKAKTRAELSIAIQKYENDCRRERESFKNSFEANLATAIPSTAKGKPEDISIPAAAQLQELQGGDIDEIKFEGIDEIKLEEPVLPHQPNNSYLTLDPRHGGNENYCFVCGQTSFIDSMGCCIACQFRHFCE